MSWYEVHLSPGASLTRLDQALSGGRTDRLRPGRAVTVTGYRSVGETGRFYVPALGRLWVGLVGKDGEFGKKLKTSAADAGESNELVLTCRECGDYLTDGAEAECHRHREEEDLEADAVYRA